MGGTDDAKRDNLLFDYRAFFCIIIGSKTCSDHHADISCISFSQIHLKGFFL